MPSAGDRVEHRAIGVEFPKQYAILPVFEAEPEACALRHVEALEVGDGARCDLAVQVLLIHEVRHADMLLLEAQALLVGRREDAVVDD